MPEPSRAAPLVIIGYDAGDPAFMTRWAREGTMPHLRSVMDRGLWAETGGPEMVSEHGVWVTLASGVSRARHGYHYYRQLRPGSYDLEPVRGRDLGVSPFWERLPPERAIAVIDVPDVPLPAPRRGVQIAEWATHNPEFPPTVEPAALRPEIERTFGPREVIDERLQSSAREDEAIFRRLLARVRRKGAMCRGLLAGGAFDLIFVVFSESHTGGHQFWRYHGRAEAPPLLGGATREIYRAIDEEAASIVALAQPGANVVVLGSIGLRGVYPAAGLGRAFCRALGYERASAAGAASRGGALGLARAILPQSARDLASRLLPRATQDRLLSEKFRGGIDWDRTSAFAIPSYYASYFRVNLSGREPRGTVAPGGECATLLSRLEEDLRALVDPVTGRPAVATVDRTADLFGPAAHAALPDLIAEWSEAPHFMERVVHPRAELSQSRCEFHRGSDHSRRGFVAAAGPAIAPRGEIGSISPADLAPTFLSLLGEAPAADLPGRPIHLE